MLVAASLIVAGAPWQPLLVGVPLRLRRGAFRAILHDRWARPLRVTGRSLLRPLVAVPAFNIALVGWQLPGPFDLAERNDAVHWLANGSLLVVGVLFWLQIIASPPLRTRITPAGQAVSLFATNCILWLLAMSMSVFSHHAWYAAYSHIPGVTLSAFGDQQIGAGILWICGDFWAGPAFMIAVRRLIAQEDGDVESAIRRIFSHGAIGRFVSPRE
jgi:cytochrome c oxidase assembly factor CtaG